MQNNYMTNGSQLIILKVIKLLEQVGNSMLDYFGYFYLRKCWFF